MPRTNLRRFGSMVTTAVVIASLTAVTVAVPGSAATPKCGGKVATIVSNNKVIRGTARADVIVAKGTKSNVIYGKGGNDVICAGKGNDRVIAGGGNDRVIAGAGRDTVKGQAGRDVLLGGVGGDTLLGGGGNDKLKGQAGYDRLDGGAGYDICLVGTDGGALTTCEKPAPPPPPDPPSGAKVFAIAYSDLDGDHVFGAGDVLISKFVDGNGDGKPNKGDTIVMDRFPLDPDASGFGQWGTKLHAVDGVYLSATQIGAYNLLGDGFYWYSDAAFEGYEESTGGTSPTSEIYDGFASPYPDSIDTHAGSPSHPSSAVSNGAGIRGDDRFIDVDLT